MNVDGLKCLKWMSREYDVLNKCNDCDVFDECRGTAIIKDVEGLWFFK